MSRAALLLFAALSAACSGTPFSMTVVEVHVDDGGTAEPAPDGRARAEEDAAAPDARADAEEPEDAGTDAPVDARPPNAEDGPFSASSDPPSPTCESYSAPIEKCAAAGVSAAWAASSSCFDRPWRWVPNTGKALYVERSGGLQGCVTPGTVNAWCCP